MIATVSPSNRIVRLFRPTERATFASSEKPVSNSGVKPTNTGFEALFNTNDGETNFECKQKSTPIHAVKRSPLARLDTAI